MTTPTHIGPDRTEYANAVSLITASCSTWDTRAMSHTEYHQFRVWMGNCNYGDVVDIMARRKITMREITRAYTTPLHWAILTDQPRIVKFLMRGGADMTITDADGFTAKERAEASKNEDIQAVVTKCLH